MSLTCSYAAGRAGQQEGGARSALLGREPGQDAQPDGNGEAIAEVDDRGHPPCQHRAGGQQLAELQPRHAHQLERAGFDLRQANRPGQPHASFEPLQGQALIALQHRGRSREEQSGGKTCVVARGRLQLQGTLDIRPSPGGVAHDSRSTYPIHQGGGLADPVMPGPGAFDALIQQGDSRGTVTLIRREPSGAVQGIHPLDVVAREPG